MKVGNSEDLVYMLIYFHFTIILFSCQLPPPQKKPTLPLVAGRKWLLGEPSFARSQEPPCRPAIFWLWGRPCCLQCQQHGEASSEDKCWHGKSGADFLFSPTSFPSLAASRERVENYKKIVITVQDLGEIPRKKIPNWLQCS